ncbi:type I pantothenate kinase [Edaphobacter bradus]|uniref:type I pantothenate kinase n=1 Tax=Edaphobacter bradus TaxID=2259016 RepID=UPI0021E06ACE|nr:type I pantothenate kinase [Edaphobacter bradus]
MTAIGNATSPFRYFSREEWTALRANTPMSLSDQDVAALRGLHDGLSLTEVAEMYLPLSRYLSLHVKAAHGLVEAQNEFLGWQAIHSPFVIAIGGSVAVGKSTFARVLQALLSRWPERPKVALVTTDGFLFPNAVLEEKSLMKRKGFPESYDIRNLLNFLHAVKAGDEVVEAPVYSHLTYDIVSGERQIVRRPDILIFEGLNVLQAPHGASVIASDFFDFSVYLDAEETDIERWYVERFLLLQHTAFQNPHSYFYRYRELPREEAVQTALRIWREINLPNLRENIQPTRQRADLILHKHSDHLIRGVWLRQ